MKSAELCAGYGGLILAIDAVLDAELAWVADNDPGASAILAARFDVPNHGDITQIDWETVEPVDVLGMGFPCTDVSLAGVRAGLTEGTRSGVWTYCAQAIAVLRPALVVIENVRGLLSAKADSGVEPCPWCLGEDGCEHSLRALGAVLADLADVGYDAIWRTVSAASAGAPHQRERVFILAWPAAADATVGRGQTRLAESAPLSRRHDAQRRGGRSGLPDRAEQDESVEAAADTAAADRRRRSGTGSTRPAAQPRESGRSLPEPHVSGIGAAADAEPGGRTRRARVPVGGAEGRATARRSGEGSPADAAGPRRSAGQDARAGAGDARPDGRGRGEPERGGHAAAGWGRYEPAIHRWERILGRPAPSPVEPGRAGPRLSPRFVEWMMGLPDGWVTTVPGLTRNAQLKALGNGVVPQQAAAALSLLLGDLEAVAA